MNRLYAKRILQVLMILSFICILYYVFIPYKIYRVLPKISLNNVERIDLWVANNPIIDITNEMNDIVLWYNGAKELRNDIGTTSDSKISIYLKDKSIIQIWNLYSDEWVVIGYKKDSEYYQTNVFSPGIANYFIDARKKYLNY